MNPDWDQADVKQVAARVSEQLQAHHITATLVGGACVSIYSENRYQSYDLDLVTEASLGDLEKALAGIGFTRCGRQFKREDCAFFLDFVAPPLAVGQKPVRRTNVIVTPCGELRLLTPTDCVEDRLAAFYHWNDWPSLEQAVMVAGAQAGEVDLAEIERWSQAEGHLQGHAAFTERLRI
jgi:hypothetical protein